jgi:hypothetical protein
LEDFSLSAVAKFTRKQAAYLEHAKHLDVCTREPLVLERLVEKLRGCGNNIVDLSVRGGDKTKAKID